MRIVLDGSPWQRPATGIAKATQGLYRACAGLEAPPEVIVVHRKALADAPPDGTTAVRFGAHLPRDLWSNYWLPHCANALGADVLHYPANGAASPALKPHAAVLVTLFDVLPLELPAHLLGGFAGQAKQREYRRRTQRAIDAADGIMTCSEYSKAQITTHFRCRTAPEVIPLGPTLVPPDRPLEPNTRGDYFIYVGGYDARKGMEALAVTFLRLHRAGRLTSRLVFAGSPREISAGFREAVEEGKRVGAIEERGYVPDGELARLLMQSLALVYPSKYEGFGLPALDAMSLGCPVITTKSTSLPEVCGDAALYVDPDDTEQFGEALVSIQDDGSLRAALSEKGRAQAAGFEWAASARKYMDWLDALVAASGTRSRRAGS